MPSTKRYKDKWFNRYDGYEHIYCTKCGHSCNFKVNHQAICNWCGASIYPSKKCEFKDRINKLLKKGK